MTCGKGLVQDWGIDVAPRSVATHRVKAKPNVVSGPTPVRVAERGPQQFDDFAHDLAPFRLRELVEKRPAEGPEPSLHAGLEQRRARYESELFHREAAFGEQAPIFLGRRKEPGRGERGIGAAAGADGTDRGSDRRDIAMPAKLADEAAARAKRTGDAGDDQFRLSHPVERGVGEHCIELGDKVERMPVNLAHGEPLHARDSEQFLAQIDAKNIGAERPDLRRERAVATAEIEDALSGLRLKHTEDSAGKLLHEATV